MIYVIAICLVLITVAQLWGQEAAQFLFFILLVLAIFAIVILAIYYGGNETASWISQQWSSLISRLNALDILP